MEWRRREQAFQRALLQEQALLSVLSEQVKALGNRGSWNQRKSAKRVSAGFFFFYYGYLFIEGREKMRERERKTYRGRARGGSQTSGTGYGLRASSLVSS